MVQFGPKSITDSISSACNDFCAAVGITGTYSSEASRPVALPPLISTHLPIVFL